MGASQSTLSSGGGTTSTTIIQVPIEESLLPPGQVQYSLRDTIDPPNENQGNNSNVSSVLKSRYGYSVDTTTTSGETMTGSSSSMGNTNAASTTPSSTSTQFYHTTSGRMMKTFPLRRRRNKGPVGAASGTGGNINQSSNNSLVESTAVVKVTWLLEQQIDQQQQPSYRELTWLEEQVVELQRIRKLTKHLPNVAPYMTWGYVNNVVEGNNRGLLVAPKQVLQNVMLVPQNQRYYLPSSSYASSTTTITSFLQPGPPIYMRAIYLLRSSVYTTLADRISCRPFLSNSEKLWITYQLLQVVQQIHNVNVIHGFLTTENIGLTSTGYVVLLDLSSYKARTMLPDDDPSEYVYYFQPNQSTTTIDSNTNSTSTTTPATTSATGGTSSSHSNEKRCYIAPERFYTPTSTTSSDASSLPTTTTNNNKPNKNEPPLVSSMDIFSLGCVITELFLNGERCFDLGDIMEYRRMNKNYTITTDVQLPNSIQQKLNKIESSAIRAACKHMIHIDPKQRLSAQEYYERLYVADKLPKPFQIYTAITERMMTGNIINLSLPSIKSDCVITTQKNESSIEVAPSLSALSKTISTFTPDARIVLLAMEYSNILWETMGIRDTLKESYFQMLIGPTLQQICTPSSSATQQSNTKYNEQKVDDYDHFNEIGSDAYTQKLFASVEALLKDLDSTVTYNTSDVVKTLTPSDASSDLSINRGLPSAALALPSPSESRSDLCKNSLLIYVQLLLSTIRHNVQRPSTKLVALQVIHRLASYVSDDVRLQRIVPVLISLLHDPDPLVRAMAVQIITSTVSIITSFPPSDSKIFPQYIFKRLTHMISDPSVVVRVTFARSIAKLAETAQRFLDISHTVRLYELVGNDANLSSGTISRDEMVQQRGVGHKDSDSTIKVFNDEITKLLDIGSRVSSEKSLGTEPMEGVVETYGTSSDRKSALASKTLISNTYSTELGSLQEIIIRWVVHIATDQSEHCSLPKRAIICDLNRLCAFFGLEGVMSFILPQILAFLNERKDWQLRALLFEHLPFVCQCIGRAAAEEFVLPCVEIGLVDSEERVICCALICLARMASTGLLSRSALLGGNEIQDARCKPSLVKKYGPLLLFPSEDIRHYAVEAIISIYKVIGYLDFDVHIFPMIRPYMQSSLDCQQPLSVDGLKKVLKPPWTRARVRDTLDDIRNSEKDRSWTSIGLTISDGKSHSLSAKDLDADNRHSTDSAEFNMLEYLKTLSRHLTQSSIQDQSLSTKTSLGLLHGIEGSGKLAQSVLIPKQNGGISKAILPDWYVSLRNYVDRLKPLTSETVSIKSVSTLREVYGLSIMGLESVTRNDHDNIENVLTIETNQHDILFSPESVSMDAALQGEWGSEVTLDPEILDATLLVTKLKAMGVPPLPVDFGDAAFPRASRGVSVKDLHSSTDWKSRPKILLATSSTINGHTAPVSRLAVSADQTIFVSASHDSTCRVWECKQIDECGGHLVNSVVYNEHLRNGSARINDVAMVEGSHSVVSGASDGSVHVWRVDMVKASGNTIQSSDGTNRHRTVGSSSIRTVDTHEGEILSVSHYNSSSASVITYATQLGMIHSWDLRCACEPFKMQFSPELGYLTSMALGSDRNWIISGTSKGFVALWDIRFQHCVKLWQHCNCVPISRLATSTVPLPEYWGINAPGSVRPFIFVAAGANECSMFDVFSSTCIETFRTVAGDSQNLNANTKDPPKLIDIPFTTSRGSGMVKTAKIPCGILPSATLSTINCMVGSVGASNNSYLITGGSDCTIRFWDFAAPSKCFIVNGMNYVNSRPTYERIDFEGQRRLMLCRESQYQGNRDSSKLPRRLFQGLKKSEQNHTDAILDIKVIDNNGIISCSRDSTIKVWR